MDLFQQRRDSGAFRVAPPVQELFNRALVAAWQVHQDGGVVSIESILERAPELTEVQVAELAESPYFQEALAARGIPNAASLAHLTADQLSVLQAMTDPSLTTPVMARLRRLGVSYKRWQGWLRQPVFAAAYQSLVEKLQKDMVGAIVTSVQQMATTDVAAAKFALELAGVYTPGASTMREEMRLSRAVDALEEAMQIFVDDPETLKKIGQYVQQRARGEQPMIEMTVLERSDPVDSPPGG